MDIKEVNDWTLGSIPNKCIDIPKIERGGDEKCIFLFLALEVKCDPYIWLFSGQIKKICLEKHILALFGHRQVKCLFYHAKRICLHKGFFTLLLYLCHPMVSRKKELLCSWSH